MTLAAAVGAEALVRLTALESCPTADAAGRERHSPRISHGPRLPTAGWRAETLPPSKPPVSLATAFAGGCGHRHGGTHSHALSGDGAAQQCIVARCR